MNLADVITQGKWEQGELLLTNLTKNWNKADKQQNIIDNKAITQLPELLGLVDILSQRLELKYKDIDEADIPMAELCELRLCRKIKKAIL